MAFNIYQMYISAWSGYEESTVMEVLETYLRKLLNDTCWDDWHNIQHFHENYCIHRGDYYGVKSDYAIATVHGKVVWEGDYPSEAIIKEILEKEE